MAVKPLLVVPDLLPQGSLVSALESIRALPPTLISPRTVSAEGRFVRERIWETVTRIPRWEPGMAELREYVGKYHSAELDATYTVAVDQGKLVVRWGNRPGLPITPARKDAFRSPLGTLTFRRTNQRLAGFRFDGARMHNLYFGRIGG